MKKLLLVLIAFTVVFVGCAGESVDDEKKEKQKGVFLKVINHTKYDILNVVYLSVEFGNINVGAHNTKSVDVNSNDFIYFELVINNKNIRFRTANRIDCTEGTIVQELNNDFVVRAVDSNITDTIEKIYITLSKPIFELSQSSTVITNDDPLPFDFGRVEISKNIQYVFTIQNAGNLPLELNGSPIIDSSNPIFSIPSQPTNTIINPGATLSFIIRYTPTAEVEDNGIITIFNNSDEVIYTFNIKGKGFVKKPQIFIMQDASVINVHGEYNLGNVAVSEPKETIFFIGNSGDADLSIISVNNNRINLENSNGNHFFIVQPSSGIITPNNQLSFVIRFNPTVEENNLLTTVVIKTNSDTNDNYSFTIKGNGYIKRSQIKVQQENTIIEQHGEFNFGSLLVNKNNDIVFTLRNIGEANLTFETVNNNRINLSDNNNLNYLIILQPSATVNVAPGGNATFTIRFNPKSIDNNLTATVTILTNSADHNEFTFRIKGIGRSYVIGDEGPGGGIIFFTAGNQFKECSGELGKATWNNAVTTINNYNANGLSDWYLPNIGEMELMFENLYKKGIGDLIAYVPFSGSEGYYWTSGERLGYKVWVYFSTSNNWLSDGNSSSSEIYRFRAVRSFTIN